MCFIPLGAPGDGFHTPPASPQSEGPAPMPGVPQLLHPTSPQPSPGAPVSSPPPVPVLTSSGKKPQPSTNPSTSSAAPEWRPPPPVDSNSFTFGPGVSPLHPKSGSTVGRGALGRNGGPPTSTPRPLASQGKTVSSSPTKSPSSLGSASPVVGSSSGQNWRERDSGLSQSLLPAQEAGVSQGEELETLLEECRSTLGITAGQDGATCTAGKMYYNILYILTINSIQVCNIFCLSTETPHFIVGLTSPRLEKGKSISLTFSFVVVVFDMHVMSSAISLSFPSEILKHLLTEVKSLKSTLQVSCP